MKSRIALLATLSAAAAAFSTGCVTYADVGPAPAYGHRYHRQGVDLVFDDGLGVYVVVGAPGIYFWHDRYYRYRRGGWYVSPRYDRGWEPIRHHRLPKRLVRHQERQYHEEHGHRHDRNRHRDRRR